MVDKGVHVQAGHKEGWWDYPVRIPSALIFVMGRRFYDWGFQFEPEPGPARSSAARATSTDCSTSARTRSYEDWARRTGDESWDYAHCLTYFKRMETARYVDILDPYRGHSGPLVVERAKVENPLFGAFLEAARQAGYELTKDVNGFRYRGNYVIVIRGKSQRPRPTLARHARPSAEPPDCAGSVNDTEKLTSV